MLLNENMVVCPITQENVSDAPFVGLEIRKDGVWGSGFYFSNNGEVLLLDSAGLLETMENNLAGLINVGCKCPITGDRITNTPRLRIKVCPGASVMYFYFSKAGEEQLLIDAGLENHELVKELFFSRVRHRTTITHIVL